MAQLFFLLTLLVLPVEAFAQTTYKLLAPLGPLTGSVTLQTYLEGILLVVIGVAGILAVLMIVICGIQMIGSPSVAQKTEAKKCITNAIWGLLLAISSWLILNTINGQLLSSSLTLQPLPTPAPAVVSVPPGSYSWSPTSTCAPVAGAIVSTVPPSYCGGTPPSGAVCCGYVTSPIPPPTISPFPPAPPAPGTPTWPPSPPAPGTPPGIPPIPGSPPPAPGTPPPSGIPLPPSPPSWTPPSIPGLPGSADALSPIVAITTPPTSGFVVTYGSLDLSYLIVEDVALDSVNVIITNSMTGDVVRTTTLCGPLGPACGPYGMTAVSAIDFSTIPNGSYTVTIEACDLGPNCGNAQIDVYNLLGCTATNPACSTDYNALILCVGRSITGSCIRGDLNSDGVIDDTDVGMLANASVFDINNDGVINWTNTVTNFNDRCFFYTAQDPLLPCALLILGDITISATDKAEFASMFNASLSGPSRVNIASLNSNLCIVFPCTTPGLGLGGTQQLSVYGEAMFSTLVTYDFNGDGEIDWGYGSADMAYVTACINTPSDPLCARADVNRDLYITPHDLFMIQNLASSWTSNLSQLSDMELQFWDGVFQPEAGILTLCQGAMLPLSLLCDEADFNNSGSVTAADFTLLSTVSQYDINGDGRVIYSPTALNPVLITATTPLISSTAFSIGNRVQAVGNIIVRSGAGNAETFIGNALNTTQGTVVGGPTFADGNWWWNVAFDNGTTGWVIESVIVITTAPPPPPPPPPPTGLSTKFRIGDVVGVTAFLAVRSSPAGAVVGSITDLIIRGNITGTPVYLSGYWWWPVTWTGAASGLSGWSAQDWMIEFIPPPAPVITTPINNGYASTTIVTVRGTMPASEVGGRVNAYRGTTPVNFGYDTINTAGLWQVTASYADGVHNVVAVATDQSNNVGPTSTVRTFTVDTIIPLAPVVLAPLTTVVTTSMVLSGTASEPSTIRIYNNTTSGTLLGTVTTSGSTNSWSRTISGLVTGTRTFAIVATDFAINVSPVTTRVVTILLPPTAPIITSPLFGLISSSTAQTVTGTGMLAGNTINLYDGGVLIATTLITTGGTWTIPVTLANGVHNITAREVDSIGQLSPISTTLTITIDTIPPPIPVMTAPLSGATVSTTSTTFAGTGSQVGNVVWVFLNGLRMISGSVPLSLGWTIVGAISPPGTYNVQVSEQDPAGNESLLSPVVTISAL